MDNFEFLFMLFSGIALIIFNKRFVRSALKHRITLGINLPENEISGRIFTILMGLILILFAFFLKYINDWQFK